MTKECLQDSTGSCAGCEIMGIVEEKSRRDGNVSKEEALQIAQEVGKNYCPQGKAILPPAMPKRSIW